MGGIWYDQLVEGDFLRTAFHPNLPFVAATTVDGAVVVYGEDAQRIDSIKIKKDATPGLITWHNSKKILACSWANGFIGIWYDYELVLREVNLHHAPIICLEFNPSGTRLISCDEDGIVMVWKMDQRGRLTSLCQYRMKEPVVKCVFASPAKSQQEQPPETCTPKSRNSETQQFFLAGVNGSVFVADDAGHCTEGFNIGPLAALLYYESQNAIVAVGNDLKFVQYRVSPEGKMTLEMEVKLSLGNYRSSSGNAISCLWVDRGVVAMSSSGNSVRIWDIANDETTNLSIPDVDTRITSLSYTHSKNILAVGCENGLVYLWKYRVLDGAKKYCNWEMLSKVNIGNPVLNVEWGSDGHFLTSQYQGGFKLIQEQVMCSHLFNNIAAVQTGPSKIIISGGKNRTVNVEVKILVKGVVVTEGRLVAFNYKSIDIWEYSFDPTPFARHVATLDNPHTNVLVDTQSVYICQSSRIDICNEMGTVKHTIHFTEEDGAVNAIDLTSNYVSVVTGQQHFKLFDVSRREPKLVVLKSIDEIQQGLQLLSAKNNSSGSMLSLLCSAKSDAQGAVETQLLVYDVERDQARTFNYAKAGLVPLKHCWDATDSRLLICQCDTFSGQSKQTQSNDTTPKEEPSVQYESQVVSFFVTQEHGIFICERTSMPPEAETLMGVSVPSIFFTRRMIADSDTSSPIVEVKPHSFQGAINNNDPTTVKAMMDFLYFLTLGNVDEALKPLKLIKSTAVWESMARTALKAKRMDVVAVCLGSVQDARALQVLRRAQKEPELEAQVAIVAAYFGAIDEAKESLKKCERYDLLNHLHQSMDDWETSLEISNRNDRINLKNTFYHFARHLNDINDLTGAIAAYEQASSTCQAFEIPQMLLSKGSELEQYVAHAKDNGVKNWWAQYLESKGDIDGALKFFEATQNTLNIVRIQLARGNVEDAIHVAEKTNHPASFYKIGQYYENAGQFKEGIQFFSKARCFNHAIRIAKEHKLDLELLHLALQGSKQGMIDAARYFEGTGKGLDKAINLYHKAGQTSKAINLCFQTRQFALLRDIAQNLDAEQADPALLKRCAEFFLENGQFDKAVRMLISGKKFKEALELCKERQITITEEMADAMTDGSGEDEKVKADLCSMIADVCVQQQSYHLACKKYTQAGDRIKAMHALLRSGDTEKIVFFANVSGSKNPEIYIMVANYLQSLDWRNNPTLMKSIVTFYTKAKALENLAGFYEACAGVEIDEFQSYEKALGALREAAKCLEKATRVVDRETKAALLDHRITLVNKFVQARAAAGQQPMDAMRICEELLAVSDIEHCVRQGDIFSLMIEICYTQGMVEQAFDLLQRMRKRIPNVNIDYFLDPRIIQAIDPTAAMSNAENRASSVSRHDEEIVEEIYK